MTDDTLPENFANHPKSISEIRSDKSNNGSLWTVRDALISALRDFDSGEIKNAKAICIFVGMVDDDSKSRTTYYQSSRNNFELYGVIEDGKNTIDKND